MKRTRAAQNAAVAAALVDYAAGEKIDVIVLVRGIGKATLHAARVKAGIPKRSDQPGYSSGAKPRIADLPAIIAAAHARGLNDTEIAAQTGMGRSVIHAHRQRMGLPVNRKARPAPQGETAARGPEVYGRHLARCRRDKAMARERRRLAKAAA